MSNPSPPTPPAMADDPHARFRRVLRWLKGLTVLAAGSCILLATLLIRGTGPASGDRASRSLGTDSAGTAAEVSKEGPWGRLVCAPIRIRPALELVLQTAPVQSTQVEWFFPKILSERLAALLSEIGLSQPVQEQLLAWAEPDPEHEGFVIRPTREFVLGLSPEDRAALYTKIEQYSPNADQQAAFRFRGDTLDEWIGDTPLASETRRLVEPLIYRHGTHLFFADLRSIEASLPSPAERSALINALSCEATFLVRLEVPKDADLDKLVEYWGRGGRQREIRPILESIQNSDESESIDITYLLPPFARHRIYTYPTSPRINARDTRDCHWTAMNFFSEVPDDRFGNINEATRCLLTDYERVSGSLQLGDVLTFCTAEGELIHSAVFIADDILFTKNGASTARPWMFMTRDDMESYYPVGEGMVVSPFRRKDL